MMNVKNDDKNQNGTMNKNNNKIKHELIARLGPRDMLGLHFSLLKHPHVSSQRYLAWVHVLLAAAVQTPA